LDAIGERKRAMPCLSTRAKGKLTLSACAAERDDDVAGEGAETEFLFAFLAEFDGSGNNQFQISLA
jgi:hypothetical protein